MFSVYRILNTLNKRVYIGSSVHPEVRKAEHFGQLRQGKHCNRFLQSDFKIYGESAFKFDVIFDGLKSRQDMLIKEYEFILKTKSFNYNIDTDCPVISLQKSKNKPKKKKKFDYPYKPEAKHFPKGRKKEGLRQKFKNQHPSLDAIAEMKKQRQIRQAP